jgi:hypothetical protein
MISIRLAFLEGSLKSLYFCYRLERVRLSLRTTMLVVLGFHDAGDETPHAQLSLSLSSILNAQRNAIANRNNRLVTRDSFTLIPPGRKRVFFSDLLFDLFFFALVGLFHLLSCHGTISTTQRV